jgi:hypothetical protein
MIWMYCARTLPADHGSGGVDRHLTGGMDPSHRRIYHDDLSEDRVPSCLATNRLGGNAFNSHDDSFPT